VRLNPCHPARCELRAAKHIARSVEGACICNGLRRGELFGLQWEDVNFDEGEIRVVRSVVDQVEELPKTLASRRHVGGACFGFEDLARSNQLLPAK
jgi:integrase